MPAGAVGVLQQLLVSLEGQLAAAKAGQLAAEQRAAEHRVAAEQAAANLQQHRNPEEGSALQQVGTQATGVCPQG